MRQIRPYSLDQHLIHWIPPRPSPLTPADTRTITGREGRIVLPIRSGTRSFRPARAWRVIRTTRFTFGQLWCELLEIIIDHYMADRFPCRTRRRSRFFVIPIPTVGVGCRRFGLFYMRSRFIPGRCTRVGIEKFDCASGRLVTRFRLEVE